MRTTHPVCVQYTIVHGHAVLSTVVDTLLMPVHHIESVAVHIGGICFGQVPLFLCVWLEVAITLVL